MFNWKQLNEEVKKVAQKVEPTLCDLFADIPTKFSDKFSKSSLKEVKEFVEGYASNVDDFKNLIPIYGSFTIDLWQVYANIYLVNPYTGEFFEIFSTANGEYDECLDFQPIKQNLDEIFTQKHFLKNHILKVIEYFANK